MCAEDIDPLGVLGWVLVAELKAMLTREKLVLDTAGSTIIVADEDGIIMEANVATSTVFGYPNVS